jgi:molybdenum cofactor cytidylyltransferase
MMENGRLDKRNISGLLIAAGLSNRMPLFKPLAKYKGNTFVTEIISKLKLVCNKIVLVTGFKENEIKSEIEKYFPQDSQIHFAYNPDYENGMLSSLQCGLSNLMNSDWVLYHFVDQPSLQAEFYKDFLDQIENGYNWIQPKFKGRNGHPIIIGRNIFQTIVSASSSENLKSISALRFVNKKLWQCNYPQILQDIDTPEDYEREIENEPL